MTRKLLAATLVAALASAGCEFSSVFLHQAVEHNPNPDGRSGAQRDLVLGGPGDVDLEHVL